MISLTLYQPDIAQNTAAMIRLCACLGVAMDVIEPCGFVWDDQRLKRVAMDYVEHVTLKRHASWGDFQASTAGRRVVLLSTKAATPYTQFIFQADDIVLVGQESAGVPDAVHAAADARVLIPMHPPARSLNVAMAAAIVLSEALRQTARK